MRPLDAIGGVRALGSVLLMTFVGPAIGTPTYVSPASLQAAGEELQISAVRATNADGKEIVNWLRPTGKDCGALRFKQSVLHGFGQGGRHGQAVEGYLDTTHKSGCGRVGETDMKVTLSPRPSPDPTLLLNLP